MIACKTSCFVAEQPTHPERNEEEIIQTFAGRVGQDGMASSITLLISFLERAIVKRLYSGKYL